MTIRKYDSSGGVVEFESAQMTVLDSAVPVDIPILQETPEQKYEGTWEPGINQLTLPPLESGPYAGITRYLPMPESQIQR